MKVICGPLLALVAALGSAPALAQSVDLPAPGGLVDPKLAPSDPIVVAAPFGRLASHGFVAPAAPQDPCVLAADGSCRVAGTAPAAPLADDAAEMAHWSLATARSDQVLTQAPRAYPALEPVGPASDENRYRLTDEGCGLACRPVGAGTDPNWADHVESDYGFWKQVGSVKTELLVFLGYFGVMSGNKLFKDTKPFHFKNEGWFGKDTDNIGVDKLTHAFNTYLLAEFLHNRIHRRTGASDGDAVTAAIIASSLMIFNEFSDGIEVDSGWSVQDVLMNLGGAGFSVLRNTVPGLKEKVSFKIEVIPNDQIYSHVGKKHYAQQRFMFSLKGSGFRELDNSPLRYLDLQLGYYASDFLLSDRAAGIEPKRHLFVGVGLNLGELLFGKSTSRVGKAAYSFLDYFQVPYTSLRYDTTGRLGN